MRYFCYNEYYEDPSTDKLGNYVVTKSEEEIRQEFYPYWYDRMCHKYGKEHVDATYSFEDCLDDWIIVNWAWESKDA